MTYTVSSGTLNPSIPYHWVTLTGGTRGVIFYCRISVINIYSWQNLNDQIWHGITYGENHPCPHPKGHIQASPKILENYAHKVWPIVPRVPNIWGPPTCARTVWERAAKLCVLIKLYIVPIKILKGRPWTLTCALFAVANYQFINFVLLSI